MSTGKKKHTAFTSQTTETLGISFLILKKPVGGSNLQPHISHEKHVTDEFTL